MADLYSADCMQPFQREHSSSVHNNIHISTHMLKQQETESDFGENSQKIPRFPVVNPVMCMSLETFLIPIIWNLIDFRPESG